MKKNNFLLTGIGAALICASAWAGQERGGGTAIVCFDNPAIPQKISCSAEPGCTAGRISNSQVAHVTSVEMLDLAQARRSRDIENPIEPRLTLVQPSESFAAYLERIAAKFDPYIPAAAKVIREGVQYAPAKKFVFEPNGLARVDDTRDFGLPDQDRCVYATLLVQTGYGAGVQVQVDERLFNHPSHSRESKAVAMLHEVVYAYGRSKDRAHDDNASFTRRFVTLALTETPRPTFIQALRDLYQAHFLFAEGAYQPYQFSKPWLALGPALAEAEAEMNQILVSAAVDSWSALAKQEESAMDSFFRDSAAVKACRKVDTSQVALYFDAQTPDFGALAWVAEAQKKRLNDVALRAQADGKSACAEYARKSSRLLSDLIPRIRETIARRGDRVTSAFETSKDRLLQDLAAQGFSALGLREVGNAWDAEMKRMIALLESPVPYSERTYQYAANGSLVGPVLTLRPGVFDPYLDYEMNW